ncbi:hypothetical protein Tco_0937929 [Tanacetum coccineum]|uniref:Uncharacterized protein n=1 Tax=Tanacetum coccineum TaxID=301880 RepID=A0ABQ5DMQ1_9ASTR
MNPVAAKQVALDNSLVPSEKRLKIEKCNARIEFNKPQREETYQVTLDALKLSPCYPAFLITAEVPKVYMHQFWNTIQKIKDTDAYRFKLDKKKFRVDTEVFHEILQICPRLPNQDFVKPPSEEELVTFIQELGYSGKCDMLYDIQTDQMNQPWRTFAAIINRCQRSKAYMTYYDFATGKATPNKARKFKKVALPSRNLSPVLEEEPAEKPKPAKKPAKKSTTVPTTGVAIRDTPSESVPKKKTPAKVDRGKGMDLLSDVALLEAAQHKKTLKISKLETHKLHASGLGDGVGSLLKVPYEQEDKTTGDSGDDDDEEYAELYKDVNERLKDTEHETQGKGDEEMTNAGRDDDNQQTKYKHVTLTTVHDTQKTEGLVQSSSFSSDFANQFLNLENVPPTDTEVVSTMNVKVCHEEPSTQNLPLLNIPVTVILETLTAAGSTIPPTIPPITPLQQQSTPTPTPAPTTTTLVPALPDFSSLFGFDQRVSALEKELSQLKQANYSAQLLKTIKSQIPAMMDAQLSTRLEDFIKKSFRSYTTEFKKKVKDERKIYIDLVEKSVKDIIKDEVKSQLPQILPKEVSDYATPVIQSLENIVLAKSSSQPKSTYKPVASLTKFELKKILLDKIQKSKSYQGAQEHKDIYGALVKSYKLDKDLFESYGKVYSLKRDREDKYKDKDKDPPAGLDQGLKKRKMRKDDEPLKGSKSKDSKSSSFKGTKSQPKSSGKSVRAEEPVFETADIEFPQDQGGDLDNTEDQPNVEAASKHDWFKKPERPSTPDPNWNTRKTIDLRPPQTWISRIAQAEKPLLTFDELMSTPIDFSAYVLNNLKIENLTQEYLVGPAFNLLKGTCKSRVELEYHFEEYQGRQVVPANYFINNDLEYLKGGSLSRKYTTSTTKTKAAMYDTIEGIEDMVPSLWSLFRRSYLDRDDLYDLNVALRMFTRRVVILKRVKDFQLGVESYQKKLNITRPETFRSDITSMTPYTAYNNPQGIIYQDKLKRNRLMHSHELYKFCDGTLSSVRMVLHDIASSLEMDYLPKRRWSKLNRKRSRIMIKAIDQQLFERRLMRNLDKFVGGRDYENDLRLLKRTI